MEVEGRGLCCETIDTDLRLRLRDRLALGAGRTSLIKDNFYEAMGYGKWRGQRIKISQAKGINGEGEDLLCHESSRVSMYREVLCLMPVDALDY